MGVLRKINCSICEVVMMSCTFGAGMIRRLLTVLVLLGCIGTVCSQEIYGAKGASVQGRVYWFNQQGSVEAFQKDLQETSSKYDQFDSCDMQRVLMNRRWQVCRHCGVVTKRSAPDFAYSVPVKCF